MSVRGLVRWGENALQTSVTLLFALIILGVVLRLVARHAPAPVSTAVRGAANVALLSDPVTFD
jgi:hypothetical protein